MRASPTCDERLGGGGGGRGERVRRTSQEVKRLRALKMWAGTDGGIAADNDISGNRCLWGCL